MTLKTALVGILAALVLLPRANATPGAAVGAIVFGTGAAIICDHVVRSYMEATPDSDEAWYLVWHHVGPEDVAGFAAGTACAIPGCGSRSGGGTRRRDDRGWRLCYGGRSGSGHRRRQGAAGRNSGLGPSCQTLMDGA